MTKRVLLTVVAALMAPTTALMAPTAARADAPRAMELFRTGGAAWRDGNYVLYSKPATTGRDDDREAAVFDARTLRVIRRLALPGGCTPNMFAFGKTLLLCRVPDGLGATKTQWRLMNVWSGEGRTFEEAGAVLDEGVTQRDTYSELGRYWAAGSRPNVNDPERYDPIYLNLQDGSVRYADRPRDIDDIKLRALPSGACGGYALRRGRYRQRFTHHFHQVVLLDCRRHTQKLIARCAQGCRPTGEPVAGGVALWLSHNARRLYARRVNGARTCTWSLPASDVVHAFVAGGRVFASLSRFTGVPNRWLVARLRDC